MSTKKNVNADIERGRESWPNCAKPIKTSCGKLASTTDALFGAQSQFLDSTGDRSSKLLVQRPR